MSANKQKLKDKLERLLDKVDGRLKPLLERLLQVVEQRDETELAAWVHLITAINKDFAKRSNLEDVIDDVVHQNGEYNQPSWDVGKVFQTTGAQFNFFIGKHVKVEGPKVTGIKMPILLLVANDTEINELVTGAAFKGHPQSTADSFNQFTEKLTVNGVVNWKRKYGSSPQDWQPLFDENVPSQSIGDIVENCIAHLSVDESQFDLIPFFVDIRQVNEPENRKVLLALRDKGCIVIIDSLSVHHPKIMQEFHRSFLDASAKTSLTVISPYANLFNLARNIQMNVCIQVSDMDFVKRKQQREDKHGVISQTADQEDFEYWLETYVKELKKSYPAKDNIFNHINNFARAHES